MSAKIVKLVQGSPDWHAHRATYRNASETPAVLGVSPWVTPYQLWLQRSGRAKPEVTVQVGRRTRSMIARVASAEEKAEVWPRLVEMYADYDDYQARTDREIPVVICSPDP